MKITLLKWVRGCCGLLLTIGLNAWAQHAPASMQKELAPIRDRATLAHCLADGSDANPLAMLSAAAQARLIANSFYHSAGEITSLSFIDIVNELKPAAACRVFGPFGFGFPCSSMIAAYGASAMDRDKVVLDSACGAQWRRVGVASTYEGYYCNGGYCQQNQHFLCNPGSCKAP